MRKRIHGDLRSNGHSDKIDELEDANEVGREDEIVKKHDQPGRQELGIRCVG